MNGESNSVSFGENLVGVEKIVRGDGRIGTAPQLSIATESTRPSSLDEVAQCLTLLSAALANELALHPGAVCNKLGGALAELGKLRTELATRIATNDRRLESLKRIDAALAELDEVFASALALSQIPQSLKAGTALGGPRHRSQRILRRAALVASISVAGFGLYGLAVPAAAEEPVSAGAPPPPPYIGAPPQDGGVMQTPRPEYDAKGVPLGAFRLFPTLDVNASYDDNVFKLPVASSDFVFEETPAVRLQSQWGRHFFEVYGGLDNLNYAQFSRLDLTDWTFGADGRYDISRAATFTANASYGEFHEYLTSPNSFGFQRTPNRYFRAHVDSVAKYQANRLGISVGGIFDRSDWENTPLIGGGFLNNSDRNESEYQGYVKVSYDFSPGYSGFVKGLYDSRAFDSFGDRANYHRSTTGYHVDAGLDLQLTHLVTGEIFVGYLTQNYAKTVPAPFLPLKSVSGIDFGVQLDWYALPVLTVHLSGSRQISDVVIAGASASDDKVIKLSADYEFRRNILIQGYASFTDSHFTGLARSDQYPGAGLSMHYLMNRYVSADVSYSYNQRSSNVAAFDYTDNTVAIGLSLHI